MNQRYTTGLLFILALILAIHQNTYACDRSEIALDSVVRSDSYVDIYITMNIGGGVTGTKKGAGAETQTFAFLFYGGETLSSISYPAAVTSDSTHTTYNGIEMADALGSKFAIAYIYNGIPFTCVSSSSLCGSVHTDTRQMVFRVNEMPDSVRLAGIEGSGNPYSGCYPDADMMVDFTTLPVVWASVGAVATEDAINVTWATAEESNNDYFEVQRSADGENFTTVGMVEAIGNSSTLQSYQFEDVGPGFGQHYYRIFQVDLDGSRSVSDVVTATLEGGVDFGITTAFPNPFQNALMIAFDCEVEGTAEIAITDLHGQMVWQQSQVARAGTNQVNLELGRFAAGVYFATVRTGGKQASKRVVKL